MSEIPSLPAEELKIVRDEFYSIALPRIDLLYNLSRWIIGDDENAAKIILRVFKDAVDFCDKTKGGATWDTWLNRIFINKINDLFLSSTKNISSEELEKIDKLNLNFANEIPSYNSIEQELHNVPSDNFRNELNKIPYPFKLPLILTEIYNLNYEAIADLVDVPVGTVNSRVFRGRKILFFKLLKTLINNNTGHEEFRSNSISIINLSKTALLVDNEFKSEEEKQKLQNEVTDNETLQKEFEYQKQLKKFFKKHLQQFSAPKKLKTGIHNLARKKFVL